MEKSPIEIPGINLSIIYHFTIFFALSFFLTLSLKSKKLDIKTIVFVFLISLFYAISDEIHQLFVLGRVADIKDVLVDMAGIALALLTLKLSEKLKVSKHHR